MHKTKKGGETDLTLSASFFFFYLLTLRVGKVDGLFVLQESTMHKRLHHKSSVCEESSIGQANL